MGTLAKAFLLAGALTACQSGGDEITGGFDERVIDGAIRRGRDLELADVDKDGDLDVIAAFSLTDAVHVYLNPGNYEDPWERIGISGERTIVGTGIATGDFDGDGDLDVAAAGAFDRGGGEASPGELTWYANPGDPRGIWQTKPISDQVYGIRTLTAEDLDGDGKRDLITGSIPVQIIVETETGTVAQIVPGGVSWWKNEGTTFFGPLVVDPVIEAVTTVLVTDFDHDDRIDLIAAAGGVPQELSFYRRTETATPTFVKYQLLGDIGTVASVLSLESEPPALLFAIAYSSSCAVQRLTATGGPGDPWQVSTIVESIGNGGDERPLLAAGDFDGDGKTDFSVTTGGDSGHIRVYLERGASFEQVDVRSGYRGVSGLASADIDKDGKYELITVTTDFGIRDRLAIWENVR